MSSRITNSMLSSNYLRNMQRNLTNMKTLQNQLASGKEINKASDNPYKASRSMQLHTEISYNKQYNENIKDTSNWLDTTDTALSQMGNVFGRIETLLVSAGNGAYGQDERIAIQDEIKEKVNELAQILNTSFDGSYIFGGTKTDSKPITVDANGKLQYANKKGEAIITYLNVAGNVTNSSISNNKVLTSNDKIYLDSNGKITTSSDAKDGTANISIIPSSSLYLDQDGNITTSSSGISGIANMSILLKDTLYTDLNGNVVTSKATENTLITSSNALYYVNPDGNVTNQKRSDGATVDNKLISSDDSLYVDSNGKVTTKSTSGGIANTLIKSGNPLYVDIKGNITTLSITVNDELSPNAPLYINTNTNAITIASADKDGNPYTLVNANSKLCIDENNNITTSLTSSDGTANKIIVLDDSLYSDIDGNIKASNDGTIPAGASSITTGIKLYIDENGKLTTSETTTNGTENIPMILGDTLYLDNDDNITISPTTENKLITSEDSLYVDADGNVTTEEGVGNTLIKSGDALYRDEKGKITITKTGNTLINTGESLYVDKSGKVTISSTTPNKELTAEDKVYVDDAKNLTMSPTTANQLLTISDIRNLQNELKDSSITQQRKTEIDNILKNADVAQLAQIDSDLKVDISEGVQTGYNKNAVDILEFKDKDGNTINVSNLLSNIIKDLGIGGTTSNLNTTHLKNIQSVTSNLLQNRSEVGTMQNRMDSAQVNNETQNYNMTDILSKTEDIDFAEKTMEYSMMQTVYTAALQTSAKILPMTILSYL